MAIFNNISDVSRRSILLVELLCCMHINGLLSVKSAVQVNKYTKKKSCRQKGSTGIGLLTNVYHYDY